MLRVVQATDEVVYSCKELCFTGAVFSKFMLVVGYDLVFFKQVDDVVVYDVL